jgi:hypothetical protein
MERSAQSEKRIRNGVEHGFRKEVWHHKKGERKAASFQGVVLLRGTGKLAVLRGGGNAFTLFPPLHPHHKKREKLQVL